MSAFRSTARRGDDDTPMQGADWVEAAYGPQARALVAALAHRMHAAEAEAAVDRRSGFDAVPVDHASARTRLVADLTELRRLVLAADVPPAYQQRDLHLRASLSVAIGAASSLASSSPSQPTAGYLKVMLAAMEDLRAAAG